MTLKASAFGVNYIPINLVYNRLKLERRARKNAIYSSSILECSLGTRPSHAEEEEGLVKLHT